MNIATTLRFPALLAALGTLLAATPANAREGHRATTDDHRFDLAIVDSIPREGAIAVIVRYGDASRNDVVVLKSATATPELLSSSLARLEADRTSAPSVASPRYEFVTSVHTGGGLPRQAVERFQAMLARVLAQPFTQIGNLGMGRWQTFADPGLRASSKP